MSSTWMVRVCGTIWLLLALTGCLAPGKPGPSWPRGFLFMDAQPGVAYTASPCGLQVLKRFPYDGVDLPSEWTPDRVEDLVVRAVAAYRGSLELTKQDPRFLESCSRLLGWTIYVVPTKNFIGTDGMPAGGETSCSMGRIFVGDSAPDVGRLSHELAHAIQGCDPGNDGKVYLDQHYNWAPIYSALKYAGLPE